MRGRHGKHLRLSSGSMLLFTTITVLMDTSLANSLDLSRQSFY
ncbi:uncharacterized protein N7518_005102 [Penicillium psychrosexuale]|nr:uncharacterized protein N7518_005102 [Penicillium psychrosexuale]KAJ5796562.1 hypothetical protein N7518_005102 [Penicillium psychrosexuale]